MKDSIKSKTEDASSNSNQFRSISSPKTTKAPDETKGKHMTERKALNRSGWQQEINETGNPNVKGKAPVGSAYFN